MSPMKQCLFIVVYCLFMDSNDKCIIKVFTIFGAISSVLELRNSRTFDFARFWFVTIRDIISDLFDPVRIIQNHFEWFIELNLSSRINPWFHQHAIFFETENCGNRIWVVCRSVKQSLPECDVIYRLTITWYRMSYLEPWWLKFGKCPNTFKITVLTGSFAVISSLITSSLCLGISRTGSPRGLISWKICRNFCNVKRIGHKGATYTYYTCVVPV